VNQLNSVPELKISFSYGGFNYTTPMEAALNEVKINVLPDISFTLPSGEGKRPR
jgi:hypothetical protein